MSPCRRDCTPEAPGRFDQKRKLENKCLHSVSAPLRQR